VITPDGSVSRADQSALNELAFHWDTAYSISFDGRTWSASPWSDPVVVLTAATADDLRCLIRRDYQEKGRR